MKSLHSSKHHAIKTYKGMELAVHAFFVSAGLACGETYRSTDWIGMRKRDVLLGIEPWSSSIRTVILKIFQDRSHIFVRYHRLQLLEG